MQLETQISIHAPVRGATVKELCEIVWGEFQSTLPRGERRVFLCHVTDNRSISIHAPASGATGDEYLELLPESISIHAPASGATRKDLCCLQQGCDFNPRSREWSDRYIPVIVLLRHISIHAPASGATQTADANKTTLPRVERLLTIRHSDRSCRFQSTLPRVERLGSV